MEKLSVLFLLFAFGQSLAYPTGAPLEACSTFIPQHPPSIADENLEITLTPHQSCYKANSEVMVKISASGEEIEGILAMAKKAGDESNVAVGKWLVGPKLQTLDCFGQSMSAITHSDEIETYGAVGLVWMAPEGFTDPVIFRTTVVHHVDEYWADIRSTELSYYENCEDQPYEVPVYVDENGNPREQEGSSATQTLPALSMIIFLKLITFL